MARQLTVCFRQLAVDVTTRIATATADELDAIAERLLTAKSLEEALR